MIKQTKFVYFWSLHTNTLGNMTGRKCEEEQEEGEEEKTTTTTTTWLGAKGRAPTKPLLGISWCIYQCQFPWVIPFNGTLVKSLLRRVWANVAYGEIGILVHLKMIPSMGWVRRTVSGETGSPQITQITFLIAFTINVKFYDLTLRWKLRSSKQVIHPHHYFINAN